VLNAHPILIVDGAVTQLLQLVEEVVCLDLLLVHFHQMCVTAGVITTVYSIAVILDV